MVDMKNIEDQLNKKLADAMSGIKARIEAVQTTLYLDLVNKVTGLVHFSYEGETHVMTVDRWRTLGKPKTITLLIAATDPIDEDAETPAPEVKDPLSKIVDIQVMASGCTEVMFTNGEVACSKSGDMTDGGLPNLRGEQYEPKVDLVDKHVISIYNPLGGFICCHVVFESGELCSEMVTLNPTVVLPEYPSLRNG